MKHHKGCSALQRQSAVTTHLVKNELRLVMGFMTCVFAFVGQCSASVGLSLTG